MTTLEMYVKLAEVVRIECGYDLLDDDAAEVGGQTSVSLRDLNYWLRELVVKEVAVPTKAHQDANDASAIALARVRGAA